MDYAFALEVWAAGFYLIGKVYLFTSSLPASRSQGIPQKTLDAFEHTGWWFYLLGVLPWLLILVPKGYWIIAAIELGGTPSMALGILKSRSTGHSHRQTAMKAWLEKWKSPLMWFFIILGVLYSALEFQKDISLRNAAKRGLELVSAVGYIRGTYLLASDKITGWLWFAAMSAATGYLMFAEERLLLGSQQALSLMIALLAYFIFRKK